MGKIKILFQINLLRTLYFNFVIKGNRSKKSLILLFKKGYFNIHKTAKINICKGQFLFSKPFNVLEPFPSLLEMQENSVLNVKNGFRILPGCHIIVAKGATLSLGSGYLNRNSRIKCYNSIEIGDNCAISENCSFWDSDVHTIQYNTIQYNYLLKLGIMFGLVQIVLYLKELQLATEQ
ncbi:MAG: hypothetical protein LBS01_00795 [Prevotellaceae bacterium]|jgi:hypothetical protein|nr:hypothetical protein [Prevotellaceae bacterium]